MELLNNINVQNMFAQLGTFVNNDFIPSDDCYPILMHIYEKLNTEDTNSRSFRLTIGFSHVVKKDLIPILIAVSNDKILQLVIKILADIMTPIECLVHIDNLFKDEIGCSTIFKLNWLLTTSKIACVNLKAIKIITHVIKENIMKLSNTQECSSSLNITISDCLRLIKNILHVPNDQYQNYILWLLFSEKFDEILIDLIANSNRRQWAVLIIELIALIFKNEHVDKMAKLLTKMNETVLSDSSEDNESNTSPHSKHGTRSSEEESESSVSDDNETDQLYNKVKLNKPNSNEYEIKINNINAKDDLDKSSLNNNILPTNLNELKSTCVFIKPSSVLCYLNRRRNTKQIKPNELNKEQRRHSVNQLKHKFEHYKTHTKVVPNSCKGNKKLKFRMKKNTKKKIQTKLNLQILPKHMPMPSDECITYFLQKFTVRFIQNGFNTLVDEIYNLLTSTSHGFILDTSLYFWILTYFCRFCKLNQIDLKSVKRIVSFKLISYIVHEGLKISEQLMIAKQQKSHDIHLQVRHLHLVIMAIKEVIKTIEFYRLTAVKSPIYVELINDLKNSGNNSPESISWAKDLKSIFALLIRHYDSDIQVIDYLHDLIVTNHMVLSLFDNLKDCWNLDNSINAHIKKFAAPDIMFNYGIVLQNYKVNDEIVNEAVFTMMHHIIGEVENTTVLFQPTITKIFLNIFYEKDYLYEKWSDLIEYVINNFTNSPHSIAEC